MTKEELKQAVIKFLDEHVTAVMATVSATGEPQAATLYYYTDNELNFYFLVAKNSKKLKNIEANKNVSLVVGFGPEPITVQAGGIADVSYDLNEGFINKVFTKVNMHSVDQWPLLRLEKGGMVTVKVTPTWLVLLNFDKQNHPETYKDEFQQLIP